MPEIVSVALSDLHLDQENARIGEPQASQPATQIALAKLLGKKLVNLAAHIVQHGTNPAELPIVVATGGGKKRYKVLEGNRRTLALKALETPAIVSTALKPVDYKRLQTLADKFATNPIEEVTCVYFKDNELDDAYEWVRIRHTGANEGRGLEGWDSDEQDRFNVRHGKNRGKAGQALDFLEQIDGVPAKKAKVSTTFDRLLGSKDVREAIGLELSNGELLSLYPLDEIVKGLRKIDADLRSGDVKVHHVYTAEQRKEYVKTFKRAELPVKKNKLAAPVKLSELPSGKAKPVAPKARPKKKSVTKKQPRTQIASTNVNLNVGSPRINDIYVELLTLDADTLTNAGAVLLRVFLELSVDDFIDNKNLMTDAQKRSTPLAGRMKKVADDMLKAATIDNSLKAMVYKVADSQHTIAASTVTFNQYVHNKYVIPKPSELRTSWDELEPFLAKIWP